MELLSQTFCELDPYWVPYNYIHVLAVHVQVVPEYTISVKYINLKKDTLLRLLLITKQIDLYK